MSNPAKKRGRQTHDWRNSLTGDPVVGLYRKPNSDVWRVRATGKEFTQRDEQAAIRRFLELTNVPVPVVQMPSERSFATPQELLEAIGRGEAPAGFGQWAVGGDGRYRWVNTAEEPAYYARIARDLSTQAGRELMARKTGIAWLQWGPECKASVAETLEDLGEVYTTYNRLSPNELSRSKLHWAEFVRVADRLGASRVNQITPEIAAAYEQFIEGQKLAPKSKLHRFRKIRGILHFAIKRGKSIEYCRKALDALAMLQVRDAHALDPTPITPAAFWAIHDQAVKSGDKTFAAMLLMALNAALYAGEAAAVRWDEIDFKTGGFVSRRAKTGVSRIACLWPETLKAIKALPRDREELFCTRIRTFTVYSVGDRLEKHRDAANVDEAVTFSWIRDAAYSTAMQESDFSKAELLAGHRLPGTADAYLRRNPQLVAPACEAVRRAFGVEKHIKGLKQRRARA